MDTRPVSVRLPASKLLQCIHQGPMSDEHGGHQALSLPSYRPASRLRMAGSCPSTSLMGRWPHGVCGRHVVRWGDCTPTTHAERPSARKRSMRPGNSLEFPDLMILLSGATRAGARSHGSRVEPGDHRVQAPQGRGALSTNHRDCGNSHPPAGYGHQRPQFAESPGVAGQNPASPPCLNLHRLALRQGTRFLSSACGCREGRRGISSLASRQSHLSLNQH